MSVGEDPRGGRTRMSHPKAQESRVRHADQHTPASTPWLPEGVIIVPPWEQK